MNPRDLLASLALSVCASQSLIAQTPHVAAADTIAIAEVARAFSAAYVRGDAAAMAAAYTEDAVIFPDHPSGSTSWSGRRAVTEHGECSWTCGTGSRCPKVAEGPG